MEKGKETKSDNQRPVKMQLESGDDMDGGFVVARFRVNWNISVTLICIQLG